MSLAQGHNTVMPVRPLGLESSTLPLSHCAPNTSAIYIQVHLRLIFIMVVNTVYPDPTHSPGKRYTVKL